MLPGSQLSIPVHRSVKKGLVLCFNSVRQRAVNSEPTLIGYLSFGAKMEGERPGSLAAKYCSIVLHFISAGRSDQKLCGNVR